MICRVINQWKQYANYFVIVTSLFFILSIHKTDSMKLDIFIEGYRRLI